MPKKTKLVYNAHLTVSKFHRNQAFHRGIRGPRGSGKSTGCCVELGTLGAAQLPYHGLRQTRFAVIRNTYRELEDTTIKTWLRWYPEAFLGKINRQTMTHHIRRKQKDGTLMDMEVLFRALDRPQDIKKTLSLELTGAYINEAKEVPFSIISGLDDAVGRFPPRDIPNGFHGPTWQGTILDTNAPDDDHWWHDLEAQYFAGDLDPKAWAFFVQPGGLIEQGGKFHHNPGAENLDNIGHDYYTLRMVGKKKDHIRVYYCNQFGFVLEGKPVHPDYVDAAHCAQEILEPVKSIPIIVGMDFGLTPAAVFGQLMPNGRWHVIDELITLNNKKAGAKQFGLALKQKINREYQGCTFEFYGDPAGTDESQTDQNTCFEILASKEVGIDAEPALVKGQKRNDLEIRRGALDAPLTRLIDGRPGFLVSTKCKTFRKGLSGGFCYKRIQTAGSERYHLKPEKNHYSHVVEAGEYMCIGGGEGDLLILTADKESDMTNQDFGVAEHEVMDMGSDGPSFGWMG